MATCFGICYTVFRPIFSRRRYNRFVLYMMGSHIVYMMSVETIIKAGEFKVPLNRMWYIQIHIYIYISCAVLKRPATPSDFHIQFPSIVPFAHSETSFTHGCTYPIFPGSTETTSFFPSFRFIVDHNFWQSHWVHSLNISIPNELFSGYAIQYPILCVNFSSNILIRFPI
jgi:hypothetical protein